MGNINRKVTDAKKLSEMDGAKENISLFREQSRIPWGQMAPLIRQANKSRNYLQ